MYIDKITKSKPKKIKLKEFSIFNNKWDDKFKKIILH